MKLFKNYNFSFDKNEAKLITNFCKQALSQFQTDSKFYLETKLFSSIIEKITDNSSNVKLTKEEVKRLSFQINENIKYLEQQMKKSWFFKRWLYKSLSTQYKSLIVKHFNDF